MVDITPISLAVSLLAVAVALLLYKKILSSPTCTDRANEIAAAIAVGAQAFLNRQYRTVALVGLPIFLLLGFLESLGWWYAGGSCWVL